MASMTFFSASSSVSIFTTTSGLAKLPDTSGSKRLDGIEAGEKLREGVPICMDGRIGRVVCQAWSFRTQDGGKRAGREGEGVLEGIEPPRNL